MPLPAQLVAMFPRAARKSARTLVSAGAVAVWRMTEATVEATVHDDGSHEASADLEQSDSPQLACSCGDFERWGPCRHIWATLVEADRRGLPVLRARDGEARSRSRRPDDWEERLRSLRDDFDENAGEAARRPAVRLRQDVEVLYVVDVPRARRTGSLALNVYVRRRLKSGRWGTMRSFAAAVDEGFSLTDGHDRVAYASLCGGAAGVTWPEAFVLPRESAALALPLLCATGRLYLDEPGSTGAEPLHLDAESDWTFGLAAERGEDRRTTLRGVLSRADERLALEDAALVVPDGWVVVGSAVGAVDTGGLEPALRALLVEGPLTFPTDEEAAALELLLELPVVPRIDGLDPGLEELIVPEPVLVARTEIDGAGLVACALSFRYGGASVSLRTRAAVLLDGEGRRRIPRDRVREDAALTELLAPPGATPAPPGDESDVLVPATALRGIVPRLLASGWQVEIAGKMHRQPGRFRGTVASGIDWFGLDGSLEFDGESAPLPDVLKALRSGQTSVVLADGSVGLLPDDWMRRWSLLSALGTADDDTLRFGRHQGWVLDALLGEREGVEFDTDFQAYRARLKEFDGIREIHEPETFQGVLRGYQREGLGWFEFLRDFDCGGCLADDMGLGKTVQVLAMIQARRDAGEAKGPSLVVAPRSVVFNWVDEAARFTPGLRVLEYTGTTRKRLQPEFDETDIIVTTYGVLRRDIAELSAREFDYAILDESQAVKNHASQSSRAARALRSHHRLALSGTPLENHVEELWSLFEFLNPGMLGRSTAFRRALQGSKTGNDDADGRRLLARALRPFLLRRTKEEVARDLPPKTEQTLHCEMPPKQRRTYRELQEHYRRTLLGGGAGGRADGRVEGSRMHVLEALLRLRQAACHPGLLDVTRRDEPTAKLDALLPLLEEVVAEGHKALVFSQFTSLLSIVHEHLDRAGLVYEVLDGSTRDRKARVQRFQTDPDCSVFVISLKAGGLGLNLTAADYVFILDPWWNPAAETQAIDRTYRIGQTRRVMAYRLICSDTVEQKIVELQQQKRDLANAILTHDNAVLRDLTSADLELLLA